MNKTSKSNKHLPSREELNNLEAASAFVQRISRIWCNQSKEVIQVGEGLPLLGHIVTMYPDRAVGRQARKLVNLIVFKNIGDVPSEALPLKAH